MKISASCTPTLARPSISRPLSLLFRRMFSLDQSPVRSTRRSASQQIPRARSARCTLHAAHGKHLADFEAPLALSLGPQGLICIQRIPSVDHRIARGWEWGRGTGSRSGGGGESNALESTHTGKKTADVAHVSTTHIVMLLVLLACDRVFASRLRSGDDRWVSSRPSVGTVRPVCCLRSEHLQPCSPESPTSRAQELSCSRTRRRRPRP
jgi:hypothetical protein